MATKNTAKKMIMTFLWDFYFEKIGSTFRKGFFENVFCGTVLRVWERAVIPLEC